MAATHKIEELVANCKFAYENFRTTALEALKRVFGSDAEMDKYKCQVAKGFLFVVKDFTPETLSLASLKAAISRSALEYRLHHLAYVFLLLVKDEYCADDAEEFREIIGPLESLRQPYKVVFRKDVYTFRDLAFYKPRKKYYFVVIKAQSESLKAFFRRVMINFEWNYRYFISQSDVDHFIDYLDEAAGYTLREPSEITVNLFFKIMDLLNRKAKDGILSQDGRKYAIYGLFFLYRYCIKHEKVIFPEQPLMDLNIFFSKETVEFFNYRYSSRENTVEVYLRGREAAMLQDIDISNPAVRSIYIDFLQSQRVDKDEFRYGHRIFVDSLGKHIDTIGLTENWDGTILIEQIRFYLELYGSKSDMKRPAMAFIKNFYLFVNEQSSGEFFRSTPNISYRLFVSWSFVPFIEQGYDFKVWGPYENFDCGEKIVFIVKDFNIRSRRFRKDDFISVDFSPIRNPLYRSLAWKAVTSEPRRLINASFRFVLKLFLIELHNLKCQEGWITPDLRMFSIFDAFAIKIYIENRIGTDNSYTSSIMVIRGFLRWADNANEMHVNDSVFDLFKTTGNSGPTNTRIVNDEEFTTISEWLLEKAKEDIRYAQALVLLNISILTPLRISHSCSLRFEELVFDDKLNSYVVHSNSKGTRGNVCNIVLGEKANLFIKKAIAISGQVGPGCSQEDLREQVFLLCRNGRYSVWRPRLFYQILIRACEACSIPRMSAKNLRATYMTRAFLEASERGELSKEVLKYLSFHRSLGTTIEHYVNHDEALAALTESINRGGDWQKTNFQDDRKALETTIADYKALLDRTDDPEEKVIIKRDMMALQQKLDSIQ